MTIITTVSITIKITKVLLTFTDSNYIYQNNCCSNLWCKVHARYTTAQSPQTIMLTITLWMNLCVIFYDRKPIEKKIKITQITLFKLHILPCFQIKYFFSFF